MAITDLPPAPQRNDPDFADVADTWVAALPTWTNQVNATASDVTNKQIAAAESEVAAELAKTNAEIAQELSEAARDLSETYSLQSAASVALLPAGTINDVLIAADKTWSSSKISSELNTIIISAKTSTYTILAIDKYKLITGSGSFTFNVDSATTLGSGWSCYIQNIGTSDITIDPYSTQTIDGQASVILEPDNLFLIISDGTNLRCIRLHKPQPHYITTSQTFVFPAGIYEIDAELWGAGGSGGYSSTSAVYTGLGGNGGSYSRKKIKGSPGTSKAITIGIGGISKTTVGDGNNGSSSSFSTDITCAGGAGGYIVPDSNYNPSSSSGGDLNVNGGMGASFKSADDTKFSFGGGSFGIPGVFQPLIAPWVLPGNFPGGGGTGGGTTSLINSGAGANGLCIIWY